MFVTRARAEKLSLVPAPSPFLIFEGCDAPGTRQGMGGGSVETPQKEFSPVG